MTTLIDSNGMIHHLFMNLIELYEPNRSKSDHLWIVSTCQESTTFQLFGHQPLRRSLETALGVAENRVASLYGASGQETQVTPVTHGDT